MLDQIKSRMDDLGKEMQALAWDDKETYLGYLAQTYYYCRNTTRLLALAGSRFPLGEEETHQRFLKHITEENRHERLAIKDIENLGDNIEQFVELPSLKAFYQTQYYHIEHQSPWNFFGYILSLEGLSVSVGPEILDKTRKAFGDKAVNFLRVHIEEDENHLEEAFHQLDGLSKERLQGIYESLDISCALFGHTLSEISKGAHRKNFTYSHSA